LINSATPKPNFPNFTLYSSKPSLLRNRKIFFLFIPTKIKSKLIKKLYGVNDITKILVTSNTLSSSKVFKNLNLKKTIHQFYPIDNSYFVNKFLRHWSPSIAIFIDSEIWPTMHTNIKNKSISLILLNARITKKSFKRWKWFPKTSQKLFEKFDNFLTTFFLNDSIYVRLDHFVVDLETGGLE
jgi:3-deoxy-D-manno-octulosonic-acid transferase